MNRKLYSLLAVLILASMALSACGGAGAGQAPSKVLTVAFEQEPDNIAGNFSNMSFSAWINQMITPGPGRWDDKNNLVPYAATEIPSAANGGVSADGLTITWKLKPNLKWSDGQPLTSKDFVTTWKAWMDPGNAVISRSGYDQIDSIDTPDDQTAVIHFKKLYPAASSSDAA